jgi:phosphotransferase system enzyme I (PtsP)
MDHLRLICDFGEMSGLFLGSMSLRAFLDRAVQMVARRLRAAVCSIYIYEEESEELVLSATIGLEPSSVGRVRLAMGEGIVGAALEGRRPIVQRIASEHPSFKSIPGIAEEHYEAFLAVPITRGIAAIGVLAVQRDAATPFDEDDALALRAVASQLANALENARLLMDAQGPGESARRDGQRGPSRGPRAQRARSGERFSGQTAAEGQAVGPAALFDREGVYESFSQRTYPRTYGRTDFESAVLATERQLEELQAKVEDKLSDVASLIFTAHLLILKDPEFTGRVLSRIERGDSAPRAVLQVASFYLQRFAASESAYIKDKVQDVKDVVVRLLGNIVGESSAIDSRPGSIVVARELYPSDLLELSALGAAGVVLVTGGASSHLSILARSLVLPLIIVRDERMMTVTEGATLLLDGNGGIVQVNPDEAALQIFHDQRAVLEQAERQVPGQPVTRTLDGTGIRILANVNLLSDVDLATELGADGIGLYRSEFPFIVRSDFPTEEEQLAVYTQLLARFRGREVNLRTLDMGGDKVLSYFSDDTREANPFLGMRSIRFSLRNPDIFRQQVRAMLRAGVGRTIRIMFPMVSALDEFLHGRRITLDCVQELQDEGVACEVPAIGMMVEVPSVLPIIDAFAAEADFLSIGSNDLIQYLLAVDRTNEKVAHLYLPHHPAVLRTLHAVVAACTRRGVAVSVCGDMAHQFQYLPFLVGIGVRSLSVEPIYLPAVQAAIAGIELPAAEALAARMLAATTVEEVTVLLPAEEFDTENLLWV